MVQNSAAVDRLLLAKEPCCPHIDGLGSLLEMVV